MPIPHIKTTNGVVTIPTPSGPISRGPSNFHYHKLLKVLKSSSSLDDIYPLCEDPECPNGIYRLFITDNIFLEHLTSDCAPSYLKLENGDWLTTHYNCSEDPLYGVFTSLDEIHGSLPELFI